MGLKILKTIDYELRYYVVDYLPPKVGETPALAKGARADLANERGKHPIYAAAWGMNPKVVIHLTRLLESVKIGSVFPSVSACI